MSEHTQTTAPAHVQTPRQATMTAAVITAPQTLEFVEQPRPEPGPGEVRVRIRGCGVCASNLPVWAGREWFDYPQPAGAPGHEAWGVVEALGANVRDVAVGDPVALLSQHAYATHDVAPVADLLPLPPRLADVAFPAEPLACAVNAFARCAIEPGQTVAIVGIGFLGALLTQLATQAGARVIAVSRRAYARRVAESCGAQTTVAFDDGQQAVTEIMALTAGEGCPRVIEATGAEVALNFAAEICAVRGRLIVAGYHQGQRCVNMQQWNWRGLDVINAHERDPERYRSGMRTALDAVTAGRLNPTPLITHRLPLFRLAEAFRLLRVRPDGFLKAVVIPPQLEDEP
ncbi:MAG: zinc-binding dehydrogenase [Caldilineaceae bacterium]|nr:zinc-binding dehydrogenase [Caldilineaceae bacterium]